MKIAKPPILIHYRISNMIILMRLYVVMHGYLWLYGYIWLSLVIYGHPSMYYSFVHFLNAHGKIVDYIV